MNPELPGVMGGKTGKSVSWGKRVKMITNYYYGFLQNNDRLDGQYQSV